MSRNGFVIHQGYSYEEIEKLANIIIERTKHRPKLGIVCGSGLGGLADILEDREFIPYKDIPNFPVSTVPGHVGRFVFGELCGKTVVCMQGRFHPYEGYPPQMIALPIRVMRLMGVETLFVTNAAGGINPDYKVGDFMIMKDHVNMPGFSCRNPLVGPNDEKWGPRFPAVSGAYDKKLRDLCKKVVDDLGYNDFIREGVYVMLGGPSFETIAECRLLRLLGADVVGMSTVFEVIAAKHCGMRCFGMSMVTNECVMDYSEEREANHEEVLDTSKKRSRHMQELVKTMVQQMPDENV